MIVLGSLFIHFIYDLTSREPGRVLPHSTCEVNYLKLIIVSLKIYLENIVRQYWDNDYFFPLSLSMWAGQIYGRISCSPDLPQTYFVAMNDIEFLIPNAPPPSCWGHGHCATTLSPQFLPSVDKEFVITPRMLVREHLSKLFGLKWLFYVHDYENIFQTYMTF